MHTCIILYTHVCTCTTYIHATLQFILKNYRNYMFRCQRVEMLKNSKKVDYSTLQDLNQIFYEGVHMYHQRITLQH
jgi:hypothetical protein